MKFLIFSTDLLPIKGAASSGTALRTHGLAEGIRSKGHEVIISVPLSAITAFENKAKSNNELEKVKLLAKSTRELAFNQANQADIISEVNPDVIIFGHWPAFQLSSRPRQKTIIDLAGPHILERHYQDSPQQNSAILAKASIIASADNLIVSGKRQAEYFKGYLARSGNTILADRFIEIPIPLSPDLPEKKDNINDYPTYFFGGVFLPWQDPSKSLKQVAKYINEKEQGKLRLIGGAHPHYKVKTGIYEDLFKELTENPRILHSELLPLEEFTQELSKADLAIDLMQKNLERELALTIRSTTYLWSGLPVIYNDYSDLSDLIKKYDAGWCIDPNDEKKLFEVLEEVSRGKDIINSKSKNAQELALNEFSWKKAAEKIESALNKPSSKLLIDASITIPDSTKYYVSKSKKIKQFFISRQKGLKQIDILLNSLPAENIENKNIVIEIKREKEITNNFQLSLDTKKYESIFKKSFQLKETFLQNWLSFNLIEETDSAGRWYEISISSEKETSQVKPWLFHARVYPLGPLYCGEKEIYNTSLCIKTHFKEQS